MGLYDYIKKLCKDRGLNTTMLANLAGISRKTIEKWNVRNPQQWNLILVADVLHVPVEMLEVYLKNPETEKKICLFCGKEFTCTQYNAGQKYCSKECQLKINRVKSAGRYKEEQERRKQFLTEKPSLIEVKKSEVGNKKEVRKSQFNEKSAKAKELGLSYGLYVARRDGFI